MRISSWGNESVFVAATFMVAVGPFNPRIALRDRRGRGYKNGLLLIRLCSRDLYGRGGAVALNPAHRRLKPAAT